MCVASFAKTVLKGLGKFPTSGICITDALLAIFFFGIMCVKEQGRGTPLMITIRQKYHRRIVIGVVQLNKLEFLRGKYHGIFT